MGKKKEKKKKNEALWMFASQFFSNGPKMKQTFLHAFDGDVWVVLGQNFPSFALVIEVTIVVLSFDVTTRSTEHCPLAIWNGIENQTHGLISVLYI